MSHFEVKYITDTYVETHVMCFGIVVATSRCSFMEKVAVVVEMVVQCWTMTVLTAVFALQLELEKLMCLSRVYNYLQPVHSPVLCLSARV